MKCPNCEHQSEAEFFECSHCGERYEREPLQIYQHLEYLLEWLEGQAEAVDTATIMALQTTAAADYQRLRDTLQLEKPRELAPATPEELEELALLEASRRQIPRWVFKNVLGESAASKLSTYFTDQLAHLRAGFLEQPAEITTPSYEEVVAYALHALESWSEGADLHPEAGARLRAFFQEQLQLLSEPKEVVKEPEAVAASCRRRCRRNSPRPHLQLNLFPSLSRPRQPHLSQSSSRRLSKRLSPDKKPLRLP